MTELLWAAGCLAFLVVLWLVMSKSKWREELGDTGDLDPSRRVGKHPALGAGYRQGPVMRKHPDERPAPRSRAPYYPNPKEVAEHHAQRRVRDNWPTKQIILTPRHLEHVNILRRRDGKPPMNAAGFRAAIAEQARTGINKIHPTDEWLAYLIAFELFDPDHQSHRVAVDTTIAIEPDAPFNGQFGGAGATGSFDPPGDPYADFAKAATQGTPGGLVAALGAGAALAGSLIEPCSLHDGSLPPPGGAAYPGNSPQTDDQPQTDPEPAPQADTPTSGGND